jgi:hypothetical protein
MSDKYLSLVTATEHTLDMWARFQQELDEQCHTKAARMQSPAERRLGIAFNDLRLALKPVARELRYADVELPF